MLWYLFIRLSHYFFLHRKKHLINKFIDRSLYLGMNKSLWLENTVFPQAPSFTGPFVVHAVSAYGHCLHWWPAAGWSSSPDTLQGTLGARTAWISFRWGIYFKVYTSPKLFATCNIPVPWWRENASQSLQEQLTKRKVLFLCALPGTPASLWQYIKLGLVPTPGLGYDYWKKL